MNRIYEEPSVEIIELVDKDIICLSGCEGTGTASTELELDEV